MRRVPRLDSESGTVKRSIWVWTARTQASAEGVHGLLHSFNAAT